MYGLGGVGKEMVVQQNSVSQLETQEFRSGILTSITDER